MLLHPVAANPTDVVHICPKKKAAGVVCKKPLDPKKASLLRPVDMEEVLIADMQH